MVSLIGLKMTAIISDFATAFNAEEWEKRNITFWFSFLIGKESVFSKMTLADFILCPTVQNWNTWPPKPSCRISHCPD